MSSASVLDLYTAHERELASVAKLHASMEELAAARDLAARVEALEALAEWVRDTDASMPWPAGEADPAEGDPRYRRLGVLAIVLERSEAARSALGGALRDALENGDALALFAEVGIPEHRGIFEEALERAQRRLLPAPRDEHDLGRLLSRILPDEGAAEWIERAPRAVLRRIVASLAVPAGSLAHVGESLADALRLLAARAESIGLSRPMRERRARALVRESPWYRLPRRTETLIARFERGDAVAADDAAQAWRETVAAARRENQDVLAHLETAGISVDLVFGIEACARMLDRMSMLAEIRLTPPGEARATACVRVISILARERARADSLPALARDTSRQLARRVVERAGASGEHYIAANAAEYARMWASAAWGGLLTVGTAALKLTIARGNFPALPEGLLGGLNYAASFTLLQATHGTLATKQPSMTAATLAGILERSEGPHRAEEMATFVARIVRSQLAAAFGNVTACALGAFAFDRLWLAIHGNHFLGAAKAEAVLSSMHMTGSATAWYAALTGVLLWLSSLVAGSIENWSAYRRIPRAIAEHRLGERLGRERMQRISAWFAQDVSAYAGSVVLGFLLGLAPAVGRFTGLPIDVRHVTLSTGQVAFAASCLGTVLDPRVGWAAGGLALMFVLNLGVSFTLALWVAGRARGVGTGDRRAVLHAVLRRMVRRPLEFVAPMRDTPG